MNYLQVKIQTPREVLFQGQAQSVSSKNSEGNFDILPQHANFLTIVENQPITIINTDKQSLKFTFAQAIIHHSNNQVSIYANPTSK